MTYYSFFSSIRFNSTFGYNIKYKISLQNLPTRWENIRLHFGHQATQQKNSGLDSQRQLLRRGDIAFYGTDSRAFLPR
jgi:hypothetical protein